MIDQWIHNVFCLPISKYGFSLKKYETKKATWRQKTVECFKILGGEDLTTVSEKEAELE